MKKFILLFFVLSISFAQNVNDYKYALVPTKFDFLKEKDMYRMNTLTKMFLQKYGFETYLDSEILPQDFAAENCNKVFVDVLNNSTFLITKLTVVVKDCKNNVLFTSREGKSSEKEYKVAFNQALREAFQSFDALNYKYNNSQKSSEIATTPVQARTKVNVSKSAVIDEKIVLTPTQAVVTEAVSTGNNSVKLFAQPIANGFQIIDSAPKVLYKIFKTSTKDFYIATKGNVQGVFFLKENSWFFEYYQNEKLVSERVNVTL